MKIDFTPWHVSDPESCNEVIDNMGRTIAQVEEWRNENRENVTLLAAAPELLEALEQAVSGYSTMIFLLDKMMPGWRTSYNFHRTQAEFKQLVAKAKGE